MVICRSRYMPVWLYGDGTILSQCIIYANAPRTAHAARRTPEPSDGVALRTVDGDGERRTRRRTDARTPTRNAAPTVGRVRHGTPETRRTFSRYALDAKKTRRKRGAINGRRDVTTWRGPCDKKTRPPSNARRKPSRTRPAFQRSGPSNAPPS